MGREPDYNQRIEELKRRVIRSEDAPVEGVFHLGQGEVATKERDVICKACSTFIGTVFVKYDIKHEPPIGRRFVYGAEHSQRAIQVIDKRTLRCPGCSEPISLKKE